MNNNTPRPVVLTRRELEAISWALTEATANREEEARNTRDSSIITANKAMCDEFAAVLPKIEESKRL